VSPHRGEAGFTLVEVLTAMTIGIVVLLATFDILDVSAKHYGKVDDRVDVVARGRLGMEAITQQIRSQVCLGPGKPAMQSGTNTSMSFVADLGGEAFQPEIRNLTYTPPSGSTGGYITETAYSSTGTPPNVTFASTPYRTRRLVDNITQAKDSVGNPVAVFTYYGFTPSPSTPTYLQTVPLDTDPTHTASADSAARTVRILISYQVLAAHAQNSSVAVPFQNYVYVRTADVTDPTRSPLCL
jgi:hypothetical protein